MRIEADIDAGQDRAADTIEAVELELALDMQDLTQSDFETCVRAAATVVGGELLFDIPADGSVEDASRIAAVRIAGENRDNIVFAVLNGSGDNIRVSGREEIGDRFHGFARAFVGVLTRIRDDLPFGHTSPEGTA
ncbi:MAG: hypothetical protein V7704_13350 [Aurantimonas endophytica]|uniref:Uncharacterized protein n=1 Tax=Aurantimonas endophytica TaxID=1522175 RepID=A0A7W6HDD8_9HYPH|nr:hypothetical protein [Aurantimonas endophytica]MBB4003007.1 hypothetical protein [Aurantimonas endophytica]MCO6403882.1 hypothetical protein [Aurantimonas endophytica]